MKSQFYYALFLVFSINWNSVGQGISTKAPAVSSGEVIRIDKMNSKFVEARNVDIWLPEGYSVNEEYAVIYMHDGQNLFDPTNTWLKKEWKVDRN